MKARRRTKRTISRVAGLAIAWAVTTNAGVASAYCREITATTPASFDPATSPTGCWAGDGSAVDVVYWKNLCVSYSLQQNGTNQLPFAMVQQVAAQAFAAWSLPLCGTGGTPTITVNELEPPGQTGVACDEVQYNQYGPNQNLVVFRDNGWPDDGDTVNTLGLTTVTYANGTGEILDADMEINSSPGHPLVASPPDPAGTYDLLSVMTHEAGHFLGLAHSADMSAVMYAFYKPGSISLQSDDIQGICTIFPPDGTRSTTAGALAAGACCSTPVGGLASACAPEAADGSVMPAPSAMPEAVAVVPCSTGGRSPPPSGKTGGCGVGGASAGSPWGALLIGVLALARRRRRLPRRLRPWALALSVAIPGTLALNAEARASVAIAAGLDELARSSAGVAVVTPLEQRTAWEQGRIITRTRVRIDRLVAGELPSEVWLRTRGGVVGDIGQIVEGEAAFAMGQASLVFLRPRANDDFAIAGAPTFVVAERAQGQYAIVADAHGALRLAQGHAGLLLTSAASSARALLHGRLVEDAVRDVSAAWARTH